MGRLSLKREKWTLSFDPTLKKFLVRTAKRPGIYPVALLEKIVKEKFNPYAFLKEIRAWQRFASS